MLWGFKRGSISGKDLHARHVLVNVGYQHSSSLEQYKQTKALILLSY